LHHQNAQSLAYGAKSGAQGAGGFAFAGAGVDDEESLFFGHESRANGYLAMPTAEGREFGDSWGKGQVQAAPPACLQQRNNKPLTSTVGNNLNLLKIFPGSLCAIL
jgi:hypothetical protein